MCPASTQPINYIDDDITRYLSNASSLLSYIDSSSKGTKTANNIFASSIIARTKDVKLGLVSSSSSVMSSFTSNYQLLGSCIDHPSSDTKIASSTIIASSSILTKSKDVSLPWLINEVDVLTTRSIGKVFDVLAAAKKTKNDPIPPPPPPPPSSLDIVDWSSTTPSYDDFLDFIFNNKALPIIVADDDEGLLCGNNAKETNISITPTTSQVVAPTSVNVVTGASKTTKEYIDQLHLTTSPPSPHPTTSTTTSTTTTTATTNDNASTLTKKLEIVLDTTFLLTDSSGSSDDSYKSHLDNDDDDVYAEDDNDHDDDMSFVNDDSIGCGGSGTWSFSAKESDDSSSSNNSNNSNINDNEEYYDYVDNDDEDTTSIVGIIDENILDYAAFRDAIMLNIDKEHTVQDGELIVLDNKEEQQLSFEELYMSNDVESQGEKSGHHNVDDEAAAAAAAEDDDNASMWSFSAVGESSSSAVKV